jgi:hypothetical protein
MTIYGHEVNKLLAELSLLNYILFYQFWFLVQYINTVLSV